MTENGGGEVGYVYCWASYLKMVYELLDLTPRALNPEKVLHTGSPPQKPVGFHSGSGIYHHKPLSGLKMPCRKIFKEGILISQIHYFVYLTELCIITHMVSYSFSFLCLSFIQQ